MESLALLRVGWPSLFFGPASINPTPLPSNPERYYANTERRQWTAGQKIGHSSHSRKLMFHSFGSCHFHLLIRSTFRIRRKRASTNPPFPSRYLRSPFVPFLLCGVCVCLVVQSIGGKTLIVKLLLRFVVNFWRWCGIWIQPASSRTSARWQVVTTRWYQLAHCLHWHWQQQQ